MKVYLVVGDTGQFGDRAKWTAKAFTSVSRAGAFCEELNAFLKFRGCHRDSIAQSDLYYESSGVTEDALQEIDPQGRIDYTGTKYEVEELEVEESP